MMASISGVIPKQGLNQHGFGSVKDYDRKHGMNNGDGGDGSDMYYFSIRLGQEPEHLQP